MESALKKAMAKPLPSDPKAAFTLGPFPKENIPKKFLKQPELEPSAVKFKAKKMPNFNAIHEKLVRNTKQSMSTSFSSSTSKPLVLKNLVSMKGSFHR